jgi:hypothetical protein
VEKDLSKMNDFKDCLLEAEKEAAIPWEKYISMAQWCIETLTKDTFTHNFRGDKNNKLKDMPPKELDFYFDIMVDTWSNGDPFYYPAYFLDKDGNATTYTDEYALSDLKKILSPGFTLLEDPIYESDDYFHVLALKKAFKVMSMMDNPPVKTALYLAEILGEIYKRTASYHKEIQQKEAIRGQNQKNRARVGRNLRIIEMNPLYRGIESLIKELKPNQDGGKKNKIYSEIDKIIRQLIDTEKKKNSSKTIRRYRENILSTRPRDSEAATNRKVSRMAFLYY